MRLRAIARGLGSSLRVGRSSFSHSEPSAVRADGESHMVRCQGLVKIYKVAELETVALQGLDLDVRRREMLAIVGNSGSGKSTLLNIIGGLDRPSAGRIAVDGRDLLQLSESQLATFRRSVVGFVWQQSARNLIPYLSALQNVQLPMIIAGRSSGGRARELLELVGLGARLHHRPPQMSGGEQQRTAIAVAMANQPPLLLADEPTGEVDTETAGEIYRSLRQVNRAYSTTVIIVSHDRTIGSRVDRVVVVRDGKVSTETSMQQILEGEEEPPQELIVVDQAGRLQIPRELIERLGLGDRVRVEIVDDHIAIRPAARGEPGAKGEKGKREKGEAG